MTKAILLLTILLALFGCGKHMYSSMSSGKENISYIIVMQEGNRINEVSIQIDNQQPELIKRVYKTKMQRKVHPILTQPGKHTIKLFIDGKVIYNENVFLGLQETKKIILP